MTLDPSLEPIVTFLSAAEARPLAEQTVDEVRAGLAALPAVLGPPEEVGAVVDDTLPGPAGPITVRRYTPDAPGPHAVLVWYHGGGFTIGSLDTHDHVCRELVNRAGCAVVSVDYRLAPEHRFPAAVDDAVAALQGVTARAEAWELDTGRMAVAGDSAGGNLAAVVARRAAAAGGPPLRHQLLVYPVTDLRPHPDWPSRDENASGYVLTRDLMDWFHDHYLGEAGGDHPDASPILADDLAGVAPATVVVCGFDPLRDEGLAYAERLRAAGVPTTVQRHDGAVHLAFQLGPVAAAGRRMVDEAAAELQRALAP